MLWWPETEPTDLYIQCTLQRDNLTKVSWLPEEAQDWQAVQLPDNSIWRITSHGKEKRTLNQINPNEHKHVKGNWTNI